MLILSRNVAQAIMIGNNVSITVLGVYGNQVRIGIAAPADVTVDPEEVFDQKERERQIRSLRGKSGTEAENE